MTEHTLAYDRVNTYERNALPGYDALEELALNLSWSWYHGSDKVWKHLDPTLWAITHNPWVVLQTVSREKLEKALANPDFVSTVNELLETNRKESSAPGWFKQQYSNSPLTCVAYFSMEFMLCEALPIYSGGLGNVAGDQTKSASDLNVPVVAIGLLYQQGYFRQIIDSEGHQQALYPYNDPGQLPVTPLRKADGEWLRLEIILPGHSVWLRTWRVKVGRVYLYLLDSNDPANLPVYRGITSELYGGGSELRLEQELILGIGGWRLLEALGINPEVCHLNEGHAAFAVLERARSYMKQFKLPFAEALSVTRSGNIFTTHTAVPAGFDRFSPELIERYLGRYAKEQLEISSQELLALGRINPHDPSEQFNMAYLAIRGSGAINGVSKLHGKVSRHIFQSLFPRWPLDEVPVGYVTNGVHMPSWDSAPADDLWTEVCGKKRWLGTTQEMEKQIRKASNEKIWKMRNENRRILIEYARERLSRQIAASGATAEEIERAKHLFDPSVLTLGFARRFATYKRPNMLLYDQERFLRILTNINRPVQLIVAGKAHPADKPGQAMIQEWMRFINRPEARPHVMFISDYDMQLTEHLVQGIDVWINTPRRPWEACGTSGMKVLVNGGLNLSELDGWWAEAYSPELGWAIGDKKEHGEDPLWDAAEATQLYTLLEREIVPEFYTRDSEGIPVVWIAKMRESMSRLTPHYSANRAVREYTESRYIPAAIQFKERSSNNGAFGTKLLKWKKELDEKWNAIRFGELKVETNSSQHTFEVQVYLDDLSSDYVKVELYAEGTNHLAPVIQEMTKTRELSGSAHTYVYQAKVTANRPATHFTPRVVPYLAGASVPLESSHILWLR